MDNALKKSFVRLIVSKLELYTKNEGNVIDLQYDLLVIDKKR